MDAALLPKLSADAHVDEPHDLWSTRLPDDLRADAPHQIQSEEDGGWRLVVNGEIDESGGQSRDPGVGGDPPGAWELEPRNGGIAFRAIEIRPKVGGLRVRARKGYYAPRG